MNDHQSSPFNLTDSNFFPIVTELLHSGLKVRFRVSGRSMAPFLQGNEIVTVVKSRIRDIGDGDLLLIRDRKTVLVHRLIRKQQTGKNWIYVTKGDGVGCYDTPVNAKSILGKVCQVEKTTASGRCVVDMQSSTWKRINRLLGVISRSRSCLARFFSFPFKLGISNLACKICWSYFSE